MDREDVIERRSLVDNGLSNDNVPLGTVKLTPAHGKGYLSRSIHFSEGISLHVQNFLIWGTGKAHLRGDPANSDQPGIFFYTCLSGVSQVSAGWHGTTGLSPLSGVELREYPTTSMTVTRSRAIRTLSVGVSPEALPDITGLARKDILEMLHRITAKFTRESVTAPSTNMELELKMVAGQVLRSIELFPEDLLYLKAKALEAVSLHLRQLALLSGNKPIQAPFHPAPDQVAVACHILKTEMGNPPGARELANRVGMNHNQLVAAFRDRLGLTPFSYLRNIRLNRARDLLSAGQCNVTEAAFLVGYGSLSHFTKAFRDRFGMTPKRWSKRKAAGRQERPTAI